MQRVREVAAGNGELKVEAAIQASGASEPRAAVASEIAQQLDTAGFFILRNVLDAELIREADEHVRWLIQKYPDLRPEHLHHPLIRDDAFWVRLVTDSRLLDIVELLLGPDIACFTAHYICKPPFDGHPVLWHQDGAYWDLQPMEAVAVWLAIDETTPQNGCLKMIPGSHRIPLQAPQVTHYPENMLYSRARDALVAEWSERSGVVNVELKPGDISIHHPHILHCSEANRSSFRRCGLDMGFIKASTQVRNKGLYLNPLLARGSPAPGINTYRQWPHYSPQNTIAFRGFEQWDATADEHNARISSASDLSSSTESSIDSTRRMIRRLQEGSVKASE